MSDDSVSGDTGSQAAGQGPAAVTIRRSVDWTDTDAAGRYHHSTVIRWVEAAEAELMAGLGLLEVIGSVPRVHYEVDYLSPVFFHDEVEVSLAVESVSTSSVRYQFEVRRTTAAPDDEAASEARPSSAPRPPVARGVMVAVLVDAGGSGPVRWPAEHRSLLLGSGTPPREGRCQAR